MRKLGLGVVVGVTIAFFVRWRGGFSRAADEVVDRLPDAATPQAEPPSEQPTEVLGGDPEDATLADRVRSEVFRDDRFKGSVNVTAQYGRIVLHGELGQPELIDELVARVRDVDGVRDVESHVQTRPAHVDVELPKRPS
jgi:osmotically-inducible protein OsmY